MKWEVLVVPKSSAADQTTLSVEADNWMGALEFGLEHLGKKDKKAKIISCQIQEDHSVRITEFSTKSTFHIKPAGGPPDLPPVPEAEGKSFLESKRSKPKIEAVRDQAEAAPTDGPAAQKVESFIQEGKDTPPVPPAVTDHSVFYKKDENPDRESAIVYRERLIKVAPDITKDKATELIANCFETLRREIGKISGDRQINLALYDHEFTGKPEGLALAAISWQEWKNPEPTIVYPKEEAARQPSPSSQGFEYAPTNPQHVSAVPQPQAEPTGPPPAAKPAPAPSTAAPSSAPPIAPVPYKAPDRFSVDVQDVQLEPVPQAAPKQAAPKQAVEEFDADRVLSEVFEELQDMFLMQTQDDCAEFVMDLAMKKIPVEGGTIFLADINTRDMLFAAVRGPSAANLKGRVLDMRKGIVGFTAREGAAIAISDVSKDPRFCSDFDQTGDFKTKSVLCAPIQYEGRTFGAIELLNKIGNDMFSQGEINVITYLASQLAEFIATSLPSGEPDFLEEESRAMQPQKMAQPASPAKRGKPKAKKKVRGKKK